MLLFQGPILILRFQVHFWIFFSFYIGVTYNHEPLCPTILGCLGFVSWRINLDKFTWWLRLGCLRIGIAHLGTEVFGRTLGWIKLGLGGLYKVTSSAFLQQQNWVVVSSFYFYLYPYLVRWSNSTSICFQMGCFNHQRSEPPTVKKKVVTRRENTLTMTWIFSRFFSGESKLFSKESEDMRTPSCWT